MNRPPDFRRERVLDAKRRSVVKSVLDTRRKSAQGSCEEKSRGGDARHQGGTRLGLQRV